MAAKAHEKLAAGDGIETPEFYKAKIATAEFYFAHILPRAQAHAESMLSPTKATMQLAKENFAFL
jgi:hypothetical protein